MSDPFIGYASSSLAIGAEVLIRKKRGFANIGNPGGGAGNSSDISFTAQIVESEHHRDSLVITSHPVEFGASVTDHAYKLPAELTLKYGWSNSPNPGLLTSALGAIAGQVGGAAGAIVGLGQAVAGGFGIGGSPQVDAVYAYLLGLQSAKTLFDVYTGKRVYTNMIIQDIETETDIETENAMITTLHCKQIIIARTSIVPKYGADSNQTQKQLVKQQ